MQQNQSTLTPQVSCSQLALLGISTTRRAAASSPCPHFSYFIVAHLFWVLSYKLDVQTAQSSCFPLVPRSSSRLRCYSTRCGRIKSTCVLCGLFNSLLCFSTITQTTRQIGGFYESMYFVSRPSADNKCLERRAALKGDLDSVIPRGLSW